MSGEAAGYAAEAKELGLQGNVRGMVVDGIVAGAGVDAGFRIGDVIIAINGKQTTTTKEFQEATENAPGAVVDVIRYGHHIYISVPPPAVVPANGNPKMPLKQVVFNLW